MTQRWLGLVALFALLRSQPTAAQPAKLPKDLLGVTIAESLGARLDLDLQFLDHRGQLVRLRRYFADGKPVILTLNYFRCTTLCDLQLNGLVNGLRGLAWVPGDQFRVVTISFDPRDTVAIAAGKRASYLRSLGKAQADWHFLVAGARDANARRVARTVGFHYRYLPDQDQYAHPAAIFLLSAGGKVARYLYGIEYQTRDLRFALVETSAGRVGSPVDKLILSCYHYDPGTGRYAPFALGIMRLGGVVSTALVGALLLVLWRRERRRRGPKETPR